MQEKQVTIGERTFILEEPFLVMATQNPIEQEGTYPLPEAQVDRFMLKIKVTYPSRQEEKQIMRQIAARRRPKIMPVISPQEIIDTRSVVDQIYLDSKIEDYIINVVFATREPKEFGLTDLGRFIEYGASPRATIYINQAARAHAFLEGRAYVTPHDIKSIGHDILRHRIILSYEAEAEDITTDDVITQLFDKIDVP